MISRCSRHSVDDILMYPTLFWLHFSIANELVHDVAEIVLPAEVGNTVLNIGKTHFISKNYLFRPQNGPDKANFCFDCRAYRYAVRSVPLVSHPYPPSWTATKPANICIIAKCAFLERLYGCIRHNSDEILL